MGNEGGERGRPGTFTQLGASHGGERLPLAENLWKRKSGTIEKAGSASVSGGAGLDDAPDALTASPEWPTEDAKPSITS